MERITIIFIIILLFVIGIFALVYFTYERPIQIGENIINKNVSLAIFDGKKQISTSFVVTLDDSVIPYKFLNTTSSGYTFFVVPLNRTFSIYNINLKNQTFYTSKYRFNDMSPSNLRLDFQLKKIVSLNVSKDGNLGPDNPINLTLIPNGTLQFVTICIRWSDNVISADIQDVESKDAPQRLLNKVDRCFYTKQSISSKTIYPINYKIFGDISSKDFLDIYIIDGDIGYNVRNQDNGYLTQSSNFKDIAYPDVHYRIEAFKNL